MTNAEYQRRWRLAHPALVRANDAKRAHRKYRMSLAEYEAMLASQGGACAICGETSPKSKRRRLDVDHDHARCEKCLSGSPNGNGHTGVRALLCHRCNSMLGLARDDVRRLENAIQYLKRHSRVLERVA